MDMKYCSIEWTTHGTCVTFNDGAHVEAWPHPTDHHYNVIAHRCGYGDDVARYCREHELAHVIVGERFHHGTSNVLWHMAHPAFQLAVGCVLLEEIAAQALQRWARANERPIVAGCDWDELKQYFLQCADALDRDFNEREQHDSDSRASARPEEGSAPASQRMFHLHD